MLSKILWFISDKQSYLPIIPSFDFPNLLQDAQSSRISACKYFCFKSSVQGIIQYFSRPFFSKLRRNFLYWYKPYTWMTREFWCRVKCRIDLHQSSSSPGFQCLRVGHSGSWGFFVQPCAVVCVRPCMHICPWYTYTRVSAVFIQFIRNHFFWSVFSELSLRFLEM